MVEQLTGTKRDRTQSVESIDTTNPMTPGTIEAMFRGNLRGRDWDEL